MRRADYIGHFRNNNVDDCVYDNWIFEPKFDFCPVEKAGYVFSSMRVTR